MFKLVGELYDSQATLALAFKIWEQIKSGASGWIVCVN